MAFSVFHFVLLYFFPQCTMNIFGSKRGHFWSISQLANSLVSWPILKISEYFYVEMVYFYFKKCNRNHFWTILKKKLKIFFQFFFLLWNFFLNSNFMLPNYEERGRTQWDQVWRLHLVHTYWILPKKVARFCSLAH